MDSPVKNYYEVFAKIDGEVVVRKFGKRDGVDNYIKNTNGMRKGYSIVFLGGYPNMLVSEDGACYHCHGITNPGVFSEGDVLCMQ